MNEPQRAHNPPLLELLKAVILLSISTIPSKRPAEYSEMAGFRPAIQIYFCVPALLAG